MVGGGEGAFIGAVHRMAAELDGEIELVCGAFSSTAEKSTRSGQMLYKLTPERCYPDFRTMMTEEAQLAEELRMDFVTIVTPNHLHCDAASLALDAGFHVVCDKPLSHQLTDAVALADKVEQSGLLFALTHNYTGYPMVREARALIAEGALGTIRRVNCEYLQGWLAGPEERGSNKQAQWRTDPARAGVAGCFGDIGSHGQNLLEYVTGDQVASVCADLSRWVADRQLDDDGNVLLRMKGGAKGILSASQIAVGEENDLRLRVYGDKGGLEWSQMAPNSLILRWADRSVETRRTGGPGVGASGADASRLPAGHPEGYIEAFAVLYRNFARAIRARQKGEEPLLDFPTVHDGLRGMRFINQVVASSEQNGAWLDVDPD
jgi:predicted dehydrogenase